MHYPPTVSPVPAVSAPEAEVVRFIDFSKEKILVVEDNRALQGLFYGIYKTIGVPEGNIAVVGTQEEAFDLYNKAAADGKPFSVVSTDNDFPKKANEEGEDIRMGIELLTSLANRNPKPAMILITGHTDMKAEHKATLREIGGEYLSKDIDYEKVKTALTKAISTRDAAQRGVVL